MKKAYYKILFNGRSCNGGDMKWSLPKRVNGKWKAGTWYKVDGNMRMCSKGLHLATFPYKHWFKNINCDVYIAEPKRIIVEQEDKILTDEARLLRKLPVPKWLKDVREFIASIKDIPYMQNDGKPDENWKLFETRNAAVDAAGNAIVNAALNAAVDAAVDAARDAIVNAAVDAAWDVAVDATRDAIVNATGNAIMNAAWDAARDAAILARCLIVADKLDPKHLAHAKERMRVWQKGYGLLCDVDGVLYVYKEVK